MAMLTPRYPDLSSLSYHRWPFNVSTTTKALQASLAHLALKTSIAMLVIKMSIIDLYLKALIVVLASKHLSPR